MGRSSTSTRIVFATRNPVPNLYGQLPGDGCRFRIRHKRSKEKRDFVVSNGTLIIMAGTMQQF